MLDIKWIRENPGQLADALVKRGQSPDAARATVEDLIAKDEARRTHLQELQEAQERRNAASREIGNAMRAGNSARAEELKAQVGEIKAFIQGGEARERALDKELENALAVVPNMPLDDVPVGPDESGNVEVRNFGAELIERRKPKMPNKPKEHFELGEALGMMDFERAAKLSGSRFTVLKGQLARLERALGQFMLDLHTTEHGYEEIQPPLMVNSASMYGTGQLPKFAGDLFHVYTEWHDLKRAFDALHVSFVGNTRNSQAVVEFMKAIASNPSPSNKAIITSFEELFHSRWKSDLEDQVDELEKRNRRLAELQQTGLAEKILIPTAEVPLTNLVREEILAHEKLPLRYTALTPCFRSEAGSAGRDTRGMLRQHQFYKVELVSITDQESSQAEHERMTTCAEEVLRRLELPFRTMVLCTGDMGFGARKTYDIEVWLPGQNAYREISSCSVCGDFQARRMEARYRPADDSAGKGTRFVHTLNGSGVAVGRALIAVMENYQNEDGSITIPQALRPYMGGLEKISGAA